MAASGLFAGAAVGFGVYREAPGPKTDGGAGDTEF